MPSPKDNLEVEQSVEPERPLIIERPDLQPLSQRWGYRSVTLFCWLLWLYLFVPLLSFIAWVAGLSFAYRLLLQDLNVTELWAMLSSYGLGIGILAGVYLSWAFYSYLRFRNVERRLATPLIDVATLAASHGLAADTVMQWREQRQQTIDPETLTAMFDRSAEHEQIDTAAVEQNGSD